MLCKYPWNHLIKCRLLCSSQLFLLVLLLRLSLSQFVNSDCLKRTTRPFERRRQRHWHSDDCQQRRCSSGWVRLSFVKDLDLIDGICQAPNGTDFGGHLQVVVWNAVVPVWSRRVMPVSRRRWQLCVLPRQGAANANAHAHAYAMVMQMLRRPIRLGIVMYCNRDKEYRLLKGLHQVEPSLTLQCGVLVGGILVLAPADADRNGHNECAEHQQHSDHNQHEPSHVHAKDRARRLICKR